VKKIFKNYKFSFILILSVVIGAVVGLIFGEKASVLSPFGDLYLNMLFIVIVPLIFLTITTSFANMKNPKRLGKVIISIFLVFIVTSLVALIIGVISTYFVKLVKVDDVSTIVSSLNLDNSSDNSVDLNLLERTVSAISVSDFSLLLSKDNIIALIVVSLLIGVAINMSKEKAMPFYNFLESAKEVLMNFIKLTMYYAPIGLGCYSASLIGTIGSSIAVGYLFTFIYYLIVALLFFFVVYTIYAYIAGGKRGVKLFWKNIIPAVVTSLATCSSAACIPVNIECAKKIGVSDDIAQTTVSLGTSFHKDGSIIGSVFKIMFLVCLFGTNIYNFSTIGLILMTALISTLLVTAVPIGGGTISETLIIVLMGYSLGALPVLTIIATIIDAPATLLNVVGDTSSSMLVSRIVDGKNWLSK